MEIKTREESTDVAKDPSQSINKISQTLRITGMYAKLLKPFWY